MPHILKTGFSLNSALVHCESLLTQAQPEPIKPVAKDAAASTTCQFLHQQEIQADWTQNYWKGRQPQTTYFLEPRMLQGN